MNSKAIITSALPYANGEIHLGHVASTYLPLINALPSNFNLFAIDL